MTMSDAVRSQQGWRFLAAARAERDAMRAWMTSGPESAHARYTEWRAAQDAVTAAWEAVPQSERNDLAISLPESW